MKDSHPSCRRSAHSRSRLPQGLEPVLDACRELGVAFVAFSPVGRGFLAGGVTDPEQLEDGDIRKGILQEDLVEAVIGLPQNLFYGRLMDAGWFAAATRPGAG